MKKKLPTVLRKASNVFHQQKTFHLPQRILTGLILVIILIGYSIKVQAQSIPTGVTDTSFLIQTTDSATYFNSSYQNFSVSTAAGTINSSGDFFLPESATPTGASADYLDVTVAPGYEIDSITYFITGNGSNKTLAPGVLGWTMTRPYNATTAPYGFNLPSITVAAKGLASATPFSYSFIGDTITEVRIYKAVKGVTITTPTTAPSVTFGANQSLQIYAIIVHLSSIIVLPVTFTAIAAQQQTNGTVNVSWKVSSQVNINQYEVEQSTNGNPYTKIGSIAAKAGTTNYNLAGINATAGSVNYRIKAIGNDGAVTYSNIANTTVAASSVSGVSIYPNPVTGNTIGIHFNNLAAGIYTAQLFNINGQQINSTSLNYDGGAGTQAIHVSQTLSPGTYQLKILTPNNAIYTTTVLMQ